jgi:phosphoribosylaminoimidazolecarboxamide formyltransferase/IMP cyclohydrolase
MFTKLHGKELSYNNLLDVDSAVNIMSEFKDSRPTFAILKHNNACGLSTRERLVDAYKCALEGDPTSAFGGVLIGNRCIDVDTATEINKLFCEVVIAPNFEEKALDILKTKKNRVILILKNETVNNEVIRTCLNGVLKQERDNITDNQTSFTISTVHKPSKTELVDLEFASKISKHTKSNTIVLAKNEQLIGSGTGQTSRVDALRHAIQKAKGFDFQLAGAVMASDAFFPFPDCVEIAQKSGITSVIQPGGSIKDKNSIEYCNNNNVSMVFTGTRHFKH